MGKILFITPNPIESASERYRIYQFLPYLERAGFACTVRPFATERLYQAIQAENTLPKLLLTPYCCLRRMLDLVVIPGYDVTVIQRGAFPFLWPALERIFTRRHGKVIFDVDDAIHIGHKNTDGAAYPWIYKLKYGPGINGTLRHFTHIVAGNKTLAEHALQFNSQVTIVPTVVDLEKYIYQAPRVSSEVLTIGWVGSRSTSPYLLGI